METYPARFRLRAVTEVSRLQEKWGILESKPLAIDSRLRKMLHQFESFVFKKKGWQPFPVPFTSILRRLELLGFLEPGASLDVPSQVMRHLAGDIALLAEPPITPRRFFGRQTIEDDPFRPNIPGPLVVPQPWTVPHSVNARMKFLLRILFWLKGLLALMDHSMDKDYEELFVLDSGSDTYGPADAPIPYPRLREVVPTSEAVNVYVCSLDRRFFGPAYIPIVAGTPSIEEVANITLFKQRHHREKLKFMEHLFFMYDIIDKELIPQVEQKLDELVNRELQWLEKNNEEPASPYYIDYEHLEDVDAETALEISAAGVIGLDSKKWDIICEAIFDVRIMVKYHREMSQELLVIVIPLIAKLMKDTRAVVAKSAIMACANLIMVYGNSIINFIDPLMDSLILKMAGLYQFVSEEASMALITMVRRLHLCPSVLLSKVVPLLHQRSPSVRAKAYQFLAQCLSVMVKYHRGMSQELLGTVIPLIAKVMKDTRAVISKSAIMTCTNLIMVYGNSIIIFVDPLMDSLVLKMAGLHRSASEEASMVIISMVRRLHLSPAVLLSKVVPLLHQRNPFLRAKAYQFLARCLSVMERNEFIVHYALLMKDRLLERKGRTLVKKSWASRSDA